MSSINLRRLGVGVCYVGLALSAYSQTVKAVESSLAPLYLANPSRSIPGRYIVVFKKSAPPAQNEAQFHARAQQRANEMRTVAHRHGVKPERVYSHALEGFAGPLSPAALNALRRDPQVAYIEEDAAIKQGPARGQAGATATTAGVPSSWGLDRINQHALPLDNFFNTRISSGVHAYIVDSGIRATHVEFAGRIGDGAGFVPDGGGTVDCIGHGTHVAGTVGGATYGVAPNVILHPVRVLDCDNIYYFSWLIDGLDWVRQNRQMPAVVNMSLWGDVSNALDETVRELIESGVTAVTISGNDSLNACGFSPARVSQAITVSASNRTDSRASYANFGSCVDVTAPGGEFADGIVSAGFECDNCTSLYYGTSMASPHVAGVVANFLARNPTASPSSVASALLSHATTGVLTDLQGSPNRLLYSNFAMRILQEGEGAALAQAISHVMLGP